MQPLSAANCNYIIELLCSGTSIPTIHNKTDASLGAIFKIHSEYCPDLPRSSSGHSCKLTSSDVQYTKCIMQMCKAENAVQMAKALKDVTNQSIFSQTICCNLREIDMKAVVKRKHLFLKLYYGKERLK